MLDAGCRMLIVGMLDARYPILDKDNPKLNAGHESNARCPYKI
jgi:hypothetical protein